MTNSRQRVSLLLVIVMLGPPVLMYARGFESAQAPQSGPLPPKAPWRPAASASDVQAIPDYVIGPDDVLSVMFWRDANMSTSEVLVRPDGKISLPLLNDIQAAGLTPEQLRDKLEVKASGYIADPTATILVRQINSRRVYVTGRVASPGQYQLPTSMTVLQLIAMAGGLQEFAKSKEIVVVRTDEGNTKSLRFNYDDVVKQKNLHQNVALKPGDIVIVP